VEDAQTQKAAIERVADKISSVFVPIVIGLAFATLAIWLIITGVGQQPPTWLPEGKSPFVFSLLFAIAVVVIACPCGIGLATPTAVMVGTGVAARHKVLIKGGNAMQKMSSVTAIVFDKTGTLTQGKPSLTDWEIFDTYSAEYSPSPSSPKRGHHKKERIVSAMAPEHFFLLVGAAESASEHPLGKAVALFAQEYLPASSLPFPTPTNVSALPGRGLVCNVSGSSVAIGNSRLMKQESISITKAAQARIDGLADQGKTPMIVAIDGKAIGLVAVSDPLRPEAAGVVAAMKKKGMHITIISGDNTRTVNFVAGQLGVADFYSQVLPKHKLKYVKKLQDSGHKVAMVGDGINDSPALAQADAGVAIGTGTDVAIEAADVVLMRSDLRDLLTAIDVAKRTYRRIWINFGWAFGYNVLAIPVAAGVFFPVVRIGLPPWIAGLAMALSSVSVVLSSLALRHYSPPKVTVATSNT
jgi:Cu+-exporting ATPase